MAFKMSTYLCPEKSFVPQNNELSLLIHTVTTSFKSPIEKKTPQNSIIHFDKIVQKGHFQVVPCFYVKTSLRKKPFKQNCITPAQTLSCKSSSFIFENFHKRIRFKTEVKGGQRQIRNDLLDSSVREKKPLKTSFVCEKNISALSKTFKISEAYRTD